MGDREYKIAKRFDGTEEDVMLSPHSTSTANSRFSGSLPEVVGMPLRASGLAADGTVRRGRRASTPGLESARGYFGAERSESAVNVDGNGNGSKSVVAEEIERTVQDAYATDSRSEGSDD